MLSNTALTNIYSGFGVAQTKLTFFIVYKVQSYSSSYIMGARSGSTNSFPVLLQVSTGQLRVYQNGTAASTYNAVPFPLTYGQSTILSSVCDTTASVAVPDKIRIWLNRTEMNDNITSIPATHTINQFYLGGLATTNSFIGDIAEVLYFNTALTDEKRQQIEAYLTEKWGL
jgi:hypothetical protein